MNIPKTIHFIAIGGPVMHDLAILLKRRGSVVTGSDIKVEGVSKSKLRDNNLLPTALGWFPDKIHGGLQTIVIGPEVTRDNPELQRAMELTLKVYSYPEFIYSMSSDKHRIVITGSFGKTMITLLILHVLNYHERSFDYVVGEVVHGLDHPVRLSEASLIIIEGQDFMASTIDPTPAFLKYQHHIGVISGIEWQQSMAYPTKEEYTRQFSIFEATTPKGGALIYFELEPVIAALSKVKHADVLYIPYKTHPSQNEDGQEFLIASSKEKFPLKISGKLNLQNISAAKETLKKIGITSEMFYQAIPSFGNSN